MVREKGEGHSKQARLYFENGYVLLQQGEVEKAAEMFWGSMAQAVKAVAAAKERELRQHREIREFARELARELQDETLWNGYISAEHLHSSFYEVTLSREDVAAIAEQVKPVIGRLLDLAEQAVSTVQ